MNYKLNPTSLPNPLNSVLSSRLAVACVLAVTLVAVWWSNTHGVSAVLASKGFSPIGWVYKTLLPGNFALDFPGGAETYTVSAFMHVYFAANRLGIAPEAFLPFVVAFEIALLSFAVFVLCRALLPQAPLMVAALVVVYSIASPARDINLANFPQPYILGQYYNVADALRLLGIVMVLKSRPVWAAVLLAGSFITHPTMGLMGLACAAAMQSMRPREILTRQFAVAALVFVLLTGGWLFVQLEDVAVSGGQIPVQIWMEMTRVFNYHWYTFDNGFFTLNPRQFFLPFLSFLLLLAYYWPTVRNDVSNKALAGVVAMLGLSLIGIAISVWVPVPFLIKLALHRASELVIFIGLPFVAAGLWRDLSTGSWWQRMGAATVVLSPWFVRPFPIVVSVVQVAPSWWRVLRRQAASSADFIVAALALAAAVLVGLYLVAGVWTAQSPLSFYADDRKFALLVVVLVLVLVLVLVPTAAFSRRLGRPAVQALVLVVALAYSLDWLKFKAENKGITRGRSYLQAQLWAREQTPSSALFMPDPTQYYGWRDFSQRSSFGNVREWLHTSWLYDSRVERYQEGMRRFGEFKIELGPYLRNQPPVKGMNQLTDEVRRRYYAASDEWRIDLAKRYGIDYFIFERSRMRAPTKLKVVYQNDHFVICAAAP